MEEKKYSERVVIRVITAMLIELVVLGAVFGV